MSNKYYFKTVKFGGFDKIDVLNKLKDLVTAHNIEIEAEKKLNNDQIEKNVETIERFTQLENSCEILKERNIKLVEYNELLISKIESKDSTLKKYAEKFSEFKEIENRKEEYINKKINDTNIRCEKMLVDAKNNANIILKNSHIEQEKRANILEKEYLAKRKHLLSLVEDYELFETHLVKTLKEMKSTLNIESNTKLESTMDNE